MTPGSKCHRAAALALVFGLAGCGYHPRLTLAVTRPTPSTSCNLLACDDRDRTGRCRSGDVLVANQGDNDVKIGIETSDDATRLFLQFLVKSPTRCSAFVVDLGQAGDGEIRVTIDGDDGHLVIDSPAFAPLPECQGSGT